MQSSTWQPAIQADYIEPRTVGDLVFCQCGALMHLERFHSIPAEPYNWVWYRCNADPDHITRSLPLRQA